MCKIEKRFKVSNNRGYATGGGPFAYINEISDTTVECILLNLRRDSQGFYYKFDSISINSFNENSLKFRSPKGLKRGDIVKFDIVSPWSKDRYYELKYTEDVDENDFIDFFINTFVPLRFKSGLQREYVRECQLMALSGNLHEIYYFLEKENNS